MSLYFLLVIPFILIFAGCKNDLSEKSYTNLHIQKSNNKLLENAELIDRQIELINWNTKNETLRNDS